jgi:hypothetical protein
MENHRAPSRVANCKVFYFKTENEEKHTDDILEIESIGNPGGDRWGFSRADGLGFTRE